MIRFVTGTDTGVGKTVVSVHLARRAQAGGASVRYVKPVQTGLARGEPGADVDVARAAGIEGFELLRFAAPLAPAVAAEVEGRTIDVPQMVDDIVKIGAGCDVLIVEGAGGLLVPITEEHTMADLATMLGAELVVVVRPGLGTLNHTALTLEAARARSLRIAGIVVCDWPAAPGVTESTNLERLRAMAPLIDIIAHDAALEKGDGPPLREPW